MKSSGQPTLALNLTFNGITVLTMSTGSGSRAEVRTGALACTEKQIGQGVPRLPEGEWLG